MRVKEHLNQPKGAIAAGIFGSLGAVVAAAGEPALGEALLLGSTTAALVFVGYVAAWRPAHGINDGSSEPVDPPHHADEAAGQAEDPKKIEASTHQDLGAEAVVAPVEERRSDLTKPEVEDGQSAITGGTEASDRNASLMPSSKPRVFVGCSVEGLPAAQFIQLHLARTTSTVIWDQGVFGLSKGTLETLVVTCHKFNYAVLVLTPDDLVIRGATEGRMARDNVLFELGLFMGALGRERVFMVVEKGVNLPSDLAGVTLAEFERGEDGTLDMADLGPVSTLLKIEMDLFRDSARHARK